MQNTRRATIRVFGFLAVACTSVALPQSAFAADEAAHFLVKLFDDACLQQDLGNPDKVRAWAREQHLNPIIDPAGLAVFVEPGENGAAWAVPKPFGNFAVSIRGKTQACAVWARTADPAEVEALFKRVVEGVKRPGIDIRVQEDKTEQSNAGPVRALVYLMSRSVDHTSWAFSMVASARPRAFQATLQVGGPAKGGGAG